MTVVKILFAAAALLVLMAFATTFASQSEQDVGGYWERLGECVWYKSRAMSNGLEGNRTQADYYWQLYSNCVRYKID